MSTEHDKRTGKAPPAIPGATTAKQNHDAILAKVPRGQQRKPGASFASWIKNGKRRGESPVPTFDDFEQLEDER